MDSQLSQSRIDWTTFWVRDRHDEDWLIEPFIARGRAHSFNAKGGDGKSLLLQECAFALATGRPVLHRPASDHPLTVVYLDMEMTEDDLWDRASDYGYSQKDDLSHLHYMLLPSLPPLDTAYGGQELCSYIESIGGADFVVIDTTARILSGDENEANTFREFYRNTGLPLKQMGTTWCRADHLGKEAEKGARGTSAKNDDVDVVWQLSVNEPRVRLTQQKRRMRWVPDHIDLVRVEDPHTRHSIAPKEIPTDFAQLVVEMDRLKIPNSTGRNKARLALKEAGIPARTETLAAAIAFRKQR